jgi:hypothetical protein
MFQNYFIIVQKLGAGYDMDFIQASATTSMCTVQNLKLLYKSDCFPFSYGRVPCHLVTLLT